MGKGLAVATFFVGGAVGFLAARQYFSDKYQKISDEEIASVKEYYAKKNPNQRPIAPQQTPVARPNLTPTPGAKINYNTFSSPAEGQEIISQKPTVTQKEPYVIPPEDFGEVEGYEQISLTYYRDLVLADDDDVVMSDPDIKKTIGEKSLSCFGQYEEDSVFVRNDVLKCDYEILLDQRDYAEVIKSKPRLEG
jgi:hypothetical protein